MYESYLQSMLLKREIDGSKWQGRETWGAEEVIRSWGAEEVNTMDYVKLNKQNDTISSYKRKETFKNRN
jgi:hypothetical protein